MKSERKKIKGGYRYPSGAAITKNSDGDYVLEHGPLVFIGPSVEFLEALLKRISQEPHK